MKALTICLALIFLTAANTFAQQQSVDGRVLDSSRKPVAGATIISETGATLCPVTDADGLFSFKGTVGDKFAVEKTGFDVKWTTIEKGVNTYKVTLDVRVQEIESVQITRQNSQVALDIANTNIIDYQPFEDCILTLKKRKNRYFVGIDSLRKEGISFPIEILRPQSFFFDCMKNAYILSADSAYQFVLLDSGIVVLSTLSYEQFELFIEPCVSKFEDRLVHRHFTDLNKTYELTMYDNKEARQIFQRTDVLGYQGAWEASVTVGLTTDPLDGDTLTDPILRRQKERREVYKRHDTGPAFQKRLEQQQKDAKQAEKYAAFDVPVPVISPNTIANSVYGKQNAWSKSQTWSSSMASYQLFTQPIHIKTYQIGNFMAVVDFLNDSVLILDHYGYRVKANSFSVDSDIEDVFQDKATGYIYLFTQDHGSHKIFGLNAFSGEVRYLKNFGGLPNTQDPVVYNNYLYYKVLDRGFFGIERVRLPKMEFF